MIAQKYKNYLENIDKFVYSNEKIAKTIFITLILKGSILIEDLPGTGKTTLSKAISKIFGYDFSRIHATSDLMPYDIIGGEYFNVKTKEIDIKKGPIFTELFLVDEINRMNPKTQSAFLQAMEEKKVSILGQNFDLSPNFSVIATQNPIEYAGTFILPEAQKDRFYSKISLGRPNKNTLKNIIINIGNNDIDLELENLSNIFTKDEINKYFDEIKKVQISDEMGIKLVDFFVEINNCDQIIYPISQRGISIFIQAIKANAFINGRDFVKPTDGEELLLDFLGHRLDINNNNLQILLELYKIVFKHF